MKSIVTMAAIGLLALSALPASAAQMLMLEAPGCAWCARFNAEIAPAWPKTREGQAAPLRRVDITKPWPDDIGFVARERFTPTFVLIDDGKEIGRIRGYPGDEFFWYLAGELIGKLSRD